MVNLHARLFSASTRNALIGIASLVIAPLFSMTPGWASSQLANEVLPSQTASSDSIEIAQLGFLEDILDTVGVPEPVTDVVNIIQAEQERQAQTEAERQAAEAERQAAEAARLEAERRQQYLESLTPEEQNAYIAEQQAIEAAQAEMAAAFFWMLVSSDGGDSDAGECEYVPYVVNGVYHGDVCQ